MGGKALLLGFWLLGYTIGFFAYVASPSIGVWLAQVLPQLFKNPTLAGAVLSGLASSIITTTAVVTWAKLSENR